METIAEKMATMESEDNREEIWQQVTEEIRFMPRHQIPMLWAALLRRLAVDPPRIPNSDITPAQWLDLCKAQYHELYRCALRDAGLNESANESSGSEKPVVMRGRRPLPAIDGIRRSMELAVGRMTREIERIRNESVAECQKAGNAILASLQAKGVTIDEASKQALHDSLQAAMQMQPHSLDAFRAEMNRVFDEIKATKDDIEAHLDEKTADLQAQLNRIVEASSQEIQAAIARVQQAIQDWGTEMKAANGQLGTQINEALGEQSVLLQFLQTGLASIDNNLTEVNTNINEKHADIMLQQQNYADHNDKLYEKLEFMQIDVETQKKTCDSILAAVQGASPKLFETLNDKIVEVENQCQSILTVMQSADRNLLQNTSQCLSMLQSQSNTSAQLRTELSTIKSELGTLAQEVVNQSKTLQGHMSQLLQLHGAELGLIKSDLQTVQRDLASVTQAVAGAAETAIKSELSALQLGIQADMQNSILALKSGIQADMQALQSGIQADMQSEIGALQQDIRNVLRSEIGALQQDIRNVPTSVAAANLTILDAVRKELNDLKLHVDSTHDLSALKTSVLAEITKLANVQDGALKQLKTDLIKDNDTIRAECEEVHRRITGVFNQTRFSDVEATLARIESKLDRPVKLEDQTAAIIAGIVKDNIQIFLRDELARAPPPQVLSPPRPPTPPPQDLSPPRLPSPPPVERSPTPPLSHFQFDPDKENGTIADITRLRRQTAFSDWIGILAEYDRQDVESVKDMLRHFANYLKQFVAFNTIKPSSISLSSTDGENWFWKTETRNNIAFIHKDILNLLTRATFLATDVLKTGAPSNPVLPVDPIKSGITGITKSIDSQKRIPASLLCLILNRYCEVGDAKDAFEIYTKFPIYFEKVTVKNPHYYKFSANPNVFRFECNLAYYFFAASFASPRENPFDVPPSNPKFVTLANTAYDPDEWFERELTRPADSWFASIASTLSASAREEPGSP